MSKRRDVFQVDQEVSGRRLEQFVAAEAERGQVAVGVGELVESVRAAEQDGVVRLEKLVAQRRIEGRVAARRPTAGCC